MNTFFKLFWRKWFWIWLSVACLSGACLMIAPAHAAEASTLTVQLRQSDGTAVVDEPVSLERLPDENLIPPICQTDNHGRCTWQVERGLYQVLFAQPLDTISTLALAEGGLRGFGLTVGDTPVTYHFTFHSDGRIYFDATPGAAIPSPVIPVGEILHGGVVPTQVPLAIVTESAAPTRVPEATPMPETAGDQTSGGWRLLLFIGSGLGIGGSLHIWSRQRQAAHRHGEIDRGIPAAPTIVHQAEEADA